MIQGEDIRIVARVKNDEPYLSKIDTVPQAQIHLRRRPTF